MAGTDEWITLARIVRPQGRRGEVLADLYTDFPEQFTTSTGLNLLLMDGSRRAVTVEEQWMPTGRNAGRVVLKLAGSESISDAELLAGCEVQLPAAERLKLEDGSFYVSDLVGCAVVDGETELGLVDDVHFPVNADGRRLDEAAPLFVVRRPGGDDVLIPFANDFVQSIDIAEKRVLLRLPEGLLDLNG